MADVCFYIVTPVYKAQSFIGECIRSVQEQTYANFRLILVDDASPDDSGKICDEFAEADSRIHVIHQKNTGPFGARRAGIRYVQEQAQPDDFLMFLDSDDSYRPHTLEKVKETIEAENCDLVFFGADNVWNGEVVHEYELWHACVGTITDKRQLYKVVFGDGWYNPLWRKAARLRIFDREDHPEWYPVRFGEDLLQSICLYKNSEKTVFLPDVLYNYTVNMASATNTVRYENYKINSVVPAAVWAFLEQETVWSEADFTEYLSWCRTLTRIEVWTIAKFETTFQNRYALLDQIREDAYYRMVMDKAPKGNLDLMLVKKRVYWPLCVIGSGMKFLGNCRRWVRKWRNNQ